MQHSPITILCADGHTDTRDLLTLVLQREGYDISTTATMHEALTTCEDHKFDLLISEQILPDGTGLDLCEQLRAHHIETPILFFTTVKFPKERQTLEAHGDYLSKPADLCELRAAVSQALHVVF